jgi:HEAT repeat protein
MLARRAPSTRGERGSHPASPGAEPASPWCNSDRRSTVRAVPQTSAPAGGSLVLPAAVAWGVLSALTVTAKSVRDALFCAHFPTAALPQTMVAGAALSALLALAIGRLARGPGPARVLPPLLCANALGFALEHALMDGAPRQVSLALYLHVSAVTGLTLSHFWSVLNERFDPHALRRNVARIGLGGTLGGFVGGLSAERIAAWAGARHALLALAAFSLIAAATIGVVAAPSAARPDAALEPEREHPFASPYLRQIAAFVAFSTLGSSVVDFAFKARAMERFTSPEALIQFFAVFYSAVSFVSFVVQATVTPRLLDRSGLGAGLGTHPAVLASAGLLSLFVPGLGAQALLRGADGALVVSLARSSYEPLYTPIAPATKRAAKSVIDVLVNRAGDGLGSALAWGLVLLVPGRAVLWANALVVAAGLAALAIALELRKGYIAELAQSLRTGAVVLDEAGVQDQTTRLTLSRTMNDLNRERLLAEIERQRARDAAPPSPAAVPDAAAGAPLVADLLSHDPARLRSALDEAEVAHVAFIIPLLARADVGERAMQVLGGFGPRIVGQLTDAALDVDGTSPTVRRRLVRVITSSKSSWAAAALAAALDDPDFDVRRQAVRGLEELSDAGVRAPLERTPALAAAARELGGAADPERVEHVLRLLGLVFDREAFRLARAALGHSDHKLHGTALEYLDNVLPASIKLTLFAALPTAVSRATSPRVERELLDELRRTLG